MAKSKQPKPKILTDRLQGRTIAIVLTGGHDAYPVIELLSQLASTTAVKIRCWVDNETSRFLTDDLFHQFGKSAIFHPGSAEEVGTDASFQTADARLILDFSKQYELRAFATEIDRKGTASYLYVAPEFSGRHSNITHIEFAGNWGPVFENVATQCTPENNWTGKNVLVTAGPTREDIDPIRYITNRSSGKMGFALARQAAIYGAAVNLIAGPVTLDIPYGVHTIAVRTADEMLEAALNYYTDADIVFAAAAVEDLKPVKVAENKIKKQGKIQIECESAVDVLAALASQKSHQFLVGFSVETEKIVQNSREKLARKSLDMIVVNNPRESGAAFQHETNKATVLTRDGQTLQLPLMTKDELAERLLELSGKAIQDNAR